MKKLVVILIVVLLVAGIAVPSPALAHGGFWPGFGVGAFAGLVLGGALAAPYYSRPYYYGPPAYYTPPPVYYPPQATCYTQPGYWQQVPYATDSEFITYQNVWVPPRTVCR